tara:strand:+ start:8082 stop:8921 length:840 start_codon:yes stop_codon:yes gene_type:complete
MQCIMLLCIALGLPVSPGLRLAPKVEPAPVLTFSVESGQSVMARGYDNTLLCTLEIPDGYHVYWKHPGASGAPTEIEVSTPAGYETGPMRWPRPETFDEPEGTTYGYAGRVTFIVPFRNTVPSPEPGEFVVSARWLACKKACFMGSATATIRVAMFDHVYPEPTEAMQAAATRMPVPIADRPSTRVTLAADRLVISGPTDPAGPPGFIPGDVPGVLLGEPTLRGDEARFELVIPFELEPGNSLGHEPRIEGLLVFGMKPRDPSYDITMPIHPAADAVTD